MVRTDFCPIIDARLIVLLSILYHILSPNQLYLLVVERHLPPSPSQLVNKSKQPKLIHQLEPSHSLSSFLVMLHFQRLWTICFQKGTMSEARNVSLVKSWYKAGAIGMACSDPPIEYKVQCRTFLTNTVYKY